MAQFIKHISLYDNTTSTSQTICAVNLNTLTVTAELGVGYCVVVYANGAVTLTPISNVVGGYGVISIRNTPTTATTGVIELTVTDSEGTSQAVWTSTNDLGRFIGEAWFTGLLKDSDLGIREGDAGGGTHEESDEKGSH